MAGGLRAWGETSGRPGYSEAAATIAAAAWRLFHDENGWRLGERQLIPGLDGEPAMQDGPMTAPSALAIAHGTQAPRERALRMSLAPVTEEPFWYASHAWQLMDFLAEKHDDTHDR